MVVAAATVVVVRYVVEVAVVTVVDVAVVVVAYVVDVAVWVVVVVIVTCAGPSTAGAFAGTRTTSATMIMPAITKNLIASWLLKSTPSRCWV